MTWQVIDPPPAMPNLGFRQGAVPLPYSREPDMSNLTSLVDRYIAMWNETDAKRRRAPIAEVWTEGASYRDPQLEGDGRAGIDAMVERVQAAYPGYRFKRISEVDSHHDQIRFAWELGPEAGPLFVRGVDVGVVAGEKLAAITGFFDQVNHQKTTPSA